MEKAERAAAIRRHKKDWVGWHVTAQALQEAAKLLLANFEQGLGRGLRSSLDIGHARAPELMLWAYCLECYLKCAIIVASPDIVDDEKRLNDALSHDLAALAKRAGIDPSNAEIRVLEVLRAFAEWRGRYPFPRSDAKFVPLPWTADDDELLQDLICRARSRGVRLK